MRRRGRAGGRPATSLRPKTSDYRSIDLAWLRRQGARYAGCSGTVRFKRNGEETGSIGYVLEGTGLRLRYQVTSGGGAPEHIDELIPIVTTPMHFGGCRHWFSCPSCGRRCRTLYGGARFRCRLCRGAAYKSQYESRPISIAAIRWRLRARLEERGSKLAGNPRPQRRLPGEAAAHALEHVPQARSTGSRACRQMVCRCQGMAGTARSTAACDRERH